MRMESGDSFNLMALYTSTQHEREALRQQHQEERQLQANRMLQAQAIDVDQGSATVYELRPAIRELARTLDAVIFVVDASSSITKSKCFFGRLCFHKPPTMVKSCPVSLLEVFTVSVLRCKQPL